MTADTMQKAEQGTSGDNKPNIRRALPSDLVQVVALYLAYHPELEKEDVTASLSGALFGSIDASTSSPHPVPCDTWLATQASEIVGFITVERSATDLPGQGSEILHLYVAPAHHSKGIGKALLDETRKGSQCASWVRCLKTEESAIAWFRTRGYAYHHTQIDHQGSKSVLRWPGRIQPRAAIQDDLPRLWEIYLAAIWYNKDIEHDSKVPDNAYELLKDRIFPRAESAKLYQAQTIVWSISPSDGSASDAIAGFYTLHIPTDKPSSPTDINLFCTDASFGAKDLGHSMLHHIFLNNPTKDLTVTTWQGNKRARAFYARNGFEEQEISEKEVADANAESRPVKVELRKKRKHPLELHTW